MASVTRVTRIDYLVVDNEEVVSAEAIGATMTGNENVLLSFFDDERVPPQKFSCPVSKSGAIGQPVFEASEDGSVTFCRRIRAKVLIRPDQAYNLAVTILRVLNFRGSQQQPESAESESAVNGGTNEDDKKRAGD